jgi:hypothetical protein
MIANIGSIKKIVHIEKAKEIEQKRNRTKKK